MALQKLPNLEMALFVECGVGNDQHGQNMTKAAVKACRNAIEFNSLPCVRHIVPNGYDGLVVTVKIGCPRPDEVDVRIIKDCFPYGKVYVQVVQGGLEAPSGVKIASMGDTEDLMLLAVVAVTVGYGLRPEDLIEV